MSPAGSNKQGKAKSKLKPVKQLRAALRAVLQRIDQGDIRTRTPAQSKAALDKQQGYCKPLGTGTLSLTCVAIGPSEVCIAVAPASHCRAERQAGIGTSSGGAAGPKESGRADPIHTRCAARAVVAAGGAGTAGHALRIHVVASVLQIKRKQHNEQQEYGHA